MNRPMNLEFSLLLMPDPIRVTSRGSTMPPEKTSFMASSIVRSVSRISPSGTKAKLPVVGLGTAGM